MKKFKSLIVMLVVLTLVMSCFVACGPADDEGGDWGTGGGTVNNGGNQGGEGTTGDPSNPGTPGSPSNPGTPGSPSNPGTPGSPSNPSNPSTPGGSSNPGSGGTQAPVELSGNPLLNPNKKMNKGAAVSYDIDKTGFSKGTLADLKGKTLTLFTGADYAFFSYHTSEGKGTASSFVNEWQWFKEIKKLYGVSVKYIRCSGSGRSNVVKPFQAMSAGKDCDLITTHINSYPYVCNILAPLDQYANFNNFENSPGLDPRITELTTWKNHPVVIGPSFANGILLYNKTYITSLGIEDPHTQFKKGEWNWSNFKKYMIALPDKTTDGKKVYGMGTSGQYYYFAPSNGKPCFEHDTKNPNGGIINNWDSPEVKETYVWLEGVCDAGGAYNSTGGGTGLKMDDKSVATVMAYSSVRFFDYIDHPDFKWELDWVPFPKNEKNSKAVNHVELYGFAIGVPRKTNKEGNRVAAVKFCELWANRYCESLYDFLLNRQKWSYEEIEFFYNYSRQYGMMGMGSGLANFHAKTNEVNVNKSITDASLSVAACIEKASNFAKQEIEAVLKFGAQ